MQPLDICVLVCSLLIISIYGLVKTRQKESGKDSARERMLGSGMSVWSVALSVCSGFISSISLLGFPAEIYYQGSMFIWMSVTYMISFPIVAYIFLPVIYNLKLTSLYEYFERRFGVECRIAAVSIFCLQTLLYNAVALYAPSLAISTLTGISLPISIVTTALLSALYICVGGAKAGVHTSALQMGLIFVTMGIIVLINLWTAGGFVHMIKIAYENHRLDIFDFRPNPLVRHSVWSLLIGGGGNILCLFAANQLSIQRYMAMPSLKEAQKVVMLNILCNGFILITYVMIGLLIYQRYAACDPLLTSMNELLPRFILDSVAHIPGIVGLFAAAVYSAGISTLSASFTAVSTVIVEDAWKIGRKKMGKDSLSEKFVVDVTRYLPLLLAFISMTMAYLCTYLQSIVLQIAFSVFGAVGGPVLGSFVVGLFFPRIRGRSGVFGLVASLLLCLSIAMGAVYNQVKPIRLPLSASCTVGSMNSTTIYDPVTFGLVAPLSSSSFLVDITKISYQYYSVIGVLANILFASAFQMLFDEADCRPSETLLSPLVRSQKVQAECVPLSNEATSA